MSPIALTDAQLDIVNRGAAPLHPADRGEYLQTVAGTQNNISALARDARSKRAIVSALENRAVAE